MSTDAHDAGFFLFGKDVARDSIAEFMHELQAANYMFDWIDLHMRDSAGQTCVSYRVDLKNSNAATSERFHQQIIGKLNDRFGKNRFTRRPKGVDLWSMSSVLESAA